MHGHHRGCWWPSTYRMLGHQQARHWLEIRYVFFWPTLSNYGRWDLAKPATLRSSNWPSFSQTTFSNAFSWMKSSVFWLEFHWSSLKGPIDNLSALVQVIAWRRTGDKPLPEPMLAEFSAAHMRHKGEMGFRQVWLLHKTLLLVARGRPGADTNREKNPKQGRYFIWSYTTI